MQFFDSFTEAYLNTLSLLKDDYQFETEDTFERIGDSFGLNDIHFNRLEGDVQKKRKINYDFCEDFAEAIINGKDYSNLRFISERAKQFVNPKLPEGMPSNFSLAYGLRIKQQEQAMFSQLKEGSRRAFMHIWCPEDYLLLSNNKFKGEFACTSSIQLFVRYKCLHMHVHMRSANAYRILPIDIFNFTTLQQRYTNQLGYGQGKFSISFGSLHMYKKDVPLVMKLK